MLDAAARARGRADRRERPLSRGARPSALARRAARGPGRAAAARAAATATAWREVRRRNAAWLRPWEATVAAGRRHGAAHASARWSATCAAQAREGRALPFVVTVRRPFRRPADRQQHRRRLGAVRRRSATGSTERYAGRGIIPTRGRAGRRPLLRLELRPAPHRGRDPAGEHRLACGWSRSSASREIGYAPRLPAHRRRLARPPALRASPARSAAAGCCARLEAPTRAEPHSHTSHRVHLATHRSACGSAAANRSVSFAPWTCQESSSSCSPSRGPST